MFTTFLNQKSEFLGGVHIAVTCGLDAEDFFENEVGGGVDDPDRPTEEYVKQVKRTNQIKGGSNWLADGQHLGNLLADDDMDEGE